MGHPKLQHDPKLNLKKSFPFISILSGPSFSFLEYRAPESPNLKIRTNVVLRPAARRQVWDPAEPRVFDLILYRPLVLVFAWILWSVIFNTRATLGTCFKSPVAGRGGLAEATTAPAWEPSPQIADLSLCLQGAQQESQNETSF